MSDRASRRSGQGATHSRAVVGTFSIRFIPLLSNTDHVGRERQRQYGQRFIYRHLSTMMTMRVCLQGAPPWNDSNQTRHPSATNHEVRTTRSNVTSVRGKQVRVKADAVPRSGTHAPPPASSTASVHQAPRRPCLQG